ncbi:sigma-70 family RNA polymerase sigma factor [Cytobacillus sp. IB215316]|uniref:sigma-70 family RNA polymerase sigma factor n=1 Tax=Cytobacillus sp. IB215316 TaxID=3097354 RepID=UPI002A1507A2|nr:sigma-70 family RNA polymerase sigma factor [Cytobacillus sp. IB215316]MDX8360795.1 sigma-70 family RNA polymerase sigma factor [Cytobacillus sp. IB215316]
MYTNAKSCTNLDDQHAALSLNELEKHYQKLTKYCHFLSQNSWDGDDLVQETLLKALQRYKDLPDMNSALLNKIAYHQWIDSCRKRQRETIESTPETIVTDVDHLEHSLDIIQKLVSKLTPKQAVVFILKEAFQYQITEIANILTTTETAVKSILHRGKKRIKNISLDDPLSPVHCLWPEQEQEQLITSLYLSLKMHDPEILIRVIPSIDSLSSDSEKPVCNSKLIRPISSRVGIVSMAA